VERAAQLGITPRELAVLSLLAAGLTAAAMARRLRISVHTVSKHQQNLYRKLDTGDRLTTVLQARQLGIIGEPGSIPD
jgi:DNA-binding NarL/FixJ family response regulator